MRRLLTANRVVGAFSLLSLVVVWASLVRLHIYRFAYLPDPVQSGRAAVDFLLSWQFLSHAAYSAYRVWLAWLIACLVATPLGLLIGWNRTLAQLGLPALEVLRPIPPIAWIPAAILFFPAVEPSVVFICFVGAFFPILLNAKSGVEQIDACYVQAARCLGAGRARVFLDVVLPGALPSVFTGFAIGMGVAWMAVVAAEMIAGEFGLGYMIWDAYALARYPLIVVGMAVIAALGAVSSAWIRWMGSRYLRWARMAA